MTARDAAVVLLAIVGAVAREVGLVLLTVADVIDPPPVSPRARDFTTWEMELR